MAAVENVEREEVKAGIATGAILLVDVREPAEWIAGHIAGAILMPLSTFDPSALPRDPARRIVLQCNSGKRTLKAIELARAAGRSDICAHYEGSWQDWLTSGEPFVTGP